MPPHKSSDYKLSVVKYYLSHSKNQVETCKIFGCSERRRNILTNDSVIFDVGLNIGNFSELICKENKYSIIYGFEPVNIYYEYAKKN